MNLIGYLLLAFTLFSFQSCSTKSLPSIQRYSLNVGVGIGSSQVYKTKCKSIKIAFPESSAEIFSKNIIYQKNLQKGSYYFSKWFSTPNDMLYRSVFSAIESGDICKYTYLEDIGNSYEYLLKSDILEFVQRFSPKGSYVEIRVVFYLINYDGTIVAQKTFDEVLKCKRDDAKGAVAAFKKALSVLIKKLYYWLGHSIVNTQSQQP